MANKKTPEQKNYERLVDEWTSTKNRCLAAWSFKQLHTFHDLLEHAGHDRVSMLAYYPVQQLQSTVSHANIVTFFDYYKQYIDWDYDKITISQKENPISQAHEYEGFTYSPIESTEKSIEASKQDTERHNQDSDEEPSVTDDEKLPHSDKQKCFLFPFQERAAKRLLDGILIKRYRGQLLRAAVGTGKTYIIGAVARRLLDMKFHEGKTFSPWAYCYITRASIVEQTKRVLETQFGIDTINELQVLNIEQLRASFGELMVRAETIIEDGDEHIIWKWRPNVHPIIFFIDESQFAKNEDSQQSKIIQAISQVDSPHVYCIFFSATPLMRVVEAKYLILNCRLHTKGFGTELAA